MINFLKKIHQKKEEKGPVFFNILTRTSGRPNGFEKCHKSIQEQSYRHFSHLVSFDSIEDLSYLNSYDIKKISVKKIKKSEVKKYKNPDNWEFSPYNLYFNKLLKEVEKGWILLLDDDDRLAHPDVLKELAEVVQDANWRTLLIWQMEYPDGSLLPTKELIENREIKLCGIGSPCFLFHSNYATRFKWDPWKCADFRFLKKLERVVENKVWIEKVYVKLHNFGDLGRRNDISK